MNQPMPNQFGYPTQLPVLPTVQELWKNEKKYRPWIIIFGVSLLVILGLVIASTVVQMTNYDSIYQSIYDELNATYKWTEAEIASRAANIAREQVYTWPIIYIVIMVIGTYLYASSLFKSYSIKSFSRLSMFSNSLLFIYAIFQIFYLFSMLWSPGKTGSAASAGNIINYVTMVLVIATAFTSGREVSKIRRQFFMSERVAMMKQQMAIMTNGQFQANSQPFINSPFGPIPQNVQPGSTPPVAPLPVNLDANGQPQVQEIPKTPEQVRHEKLNALTIEQLHEIAGKLSISGHETMTKDELILDIMRITKDSTHHN